MIRLPHACRGRTAVRFPTNSSHMCFVELAAVKDLWGPITMPCWWVPIRANQLSVAATARVIWLCACARYWPGCGLVCVCPLPYVCLLPIRRFVTTQIFSVYSSCHFTVVTTNTRPQALRFFLRVQTLRFGGRQSTATMVFYALAQSGFFPRFSSTRKNMSAFKPFLQYFATGSGTTSCQDYEEYKFVECLSEETQITHVFTHCKLQTHKLSQCTLAIRPSSC